ncbi:hypothetical protein HYH02_008268 [Chlamydomonas schloesseri]|uniref:Serine hydrolase domain-containing protein n=1 Tax=Chlamydomonas schloesseri TaxID=2026947 RepID=A0A835WG47_9CHLO|nr:hypothetical protein HYH02_008268 [Chlamydomonas schloesseri]|eukprot:KAG2446703.1 hypothetical protein HYH02_008268 [Chlamydomonas schloesseri]
MNSRPRLLAFHGWRTSATILQQQLQLSSLDITVGDLVDITYLNGPHAAKGPPTPDVARFFSPPFVEFWDAVTDPATGVVTYAGAEESLAAVETELRAAAAVGQPVSALLGFSQGAALAALVLALQERGLRFQDLPPLRCAVLISGSLVRDPAWAAVYNMNSAKSASAGDGSAEVGGSSSTITITSSCGGAASETTASALPETSHARHTPGAGGLLRRPTCHFIGAADPMRSRSEQLASRYQEPIVLHHQQGHVVPRLPADAKEQLRTFLQQHLHDCGGTWQGAR